MPFGKTTTVSHLVVITNQVRLNSNNQQMYNKVRKTESLWLLPPAKHRK